MPIDYLPTLVLVYTASFMIIISPGPSSFAIMSSSMTFGRKEGFLVMLGVVCGAMTWGTLASVGVSAFLAAKPNAVGVIKVFGGVYLLYLAFKAFIRMLALLPKDNLSRQPFTRISFIKGYCIHMTNPEAMLGWIALITLGIKSNSPALAPFYIVGGCLVIGIMVYGANAYLFSTNKIIETYRCYRRAIEAVFTVVFGFAGATLLISVT